MEKQPNVDIQSTDSWAIGMGIAVAGVALLSAVLSMAMTPGAVPPRRVSRRKAPARYPRFSLCPRICSASVTRWPKPRP